MQNAPMVRSMVLAIVTRDRKDVVRGRGRRQLQAGSSDDFVSAHSALAQPRLRRRSEALRGLLVLHAHEHPKRGVQTARLVFRLQSAWAASINLWAISTLVRIGRPSA